MAAAERGGAVGSGCVSGEADPHSCSPYPNHVSPMSRMLGLDRRAFCCTEGNWKAAQGEEHWAGESGTEKPANKCDAHWFAHIKTVTCWKNCQSGSLLKWCQNPVML